MVRILQNKITAASTAVSPLHTRYYMGKVIYKDREYDRAQEPLVSLELFDAVGRLLESRNQSGSR